MDLTSLPNGVWSSRTQKLQSLSDDQRSAIREQSRASQHNPSPENYSKVAINGREYSVTYRPQDDFFTVKRINGSQGRLVQWLYSMAGHPRGQITWQLTRQLNLPHPSTLPTHSPSSPFEWANKFTDAVLRQKIGEPLTTAQRDFSNADFCNIKLNELLPPSFRSRDGDVIHGFNFSNSRFARSDISHLHFDQCQFSNSTLNTANCRNAKFSNSEMDELHLFFPYPTEEKPLFINVTLKNSVVNMTTNISDIILNAPDNSPPPLNHVIRVGDFWLSIPPCWSERNIDQSLNHERNEGRSLLMTIDNLSDKYSQEKVRAMEELVKTLRNAELSETDIRPVESSLVSILAHPPYTQSALISEWLRPVQERFFTRQGQTYNETPLPVPDIYRQQRILPVLLDSFDKNSTAMSTYNGFFNQVILHSMTGADSTDITRQKASALYERYLAHPSVSPHTNNGLFGDYDGSPDWTTSAADNFLLLSSRAPDMAMMLSADTLLTMLNPTPDTAWDHFYLMRSGENISGSQTSPEELFRQDFKVFYAAYNQEAQQRRFAHLIDTIFYPLKRTRSLTSSLSRPQTRAIPPLNLSMKPQCRA